MDELSRTDRTTLRRLPNRGVYDRALIHSILDEGLICHVGFIAGRAAFRDPHDPCDGWASGLFARLAGEPDAQGPGAGSRGLCHGHPP